MKQRGHAALKNKAKKTKNLAPSVPATVGPDTLCARALIKA